RIIAHLKDNVGSANRAIGPDVFEIAERLASPTMVSPWSASVIQYHLYERYLQVLAKDPMTAKKILLNIGKAYRYMGWYDKAEKTMKEGLKYFRGDVNFRRGLAVVYAEQKMYRKAAEVFSQVGDSFAEGVAWTLAEQHDRAIEVFSKLLTSNLDHQHPGEHARAWTVTGDIYEERGDRQSLLKAKNCHEKALFLIQSAANYKRLSDILQRLGRDDEAKEIYRKALQLHQEGQPLEDEPLSLNALFTE
ncbi:MAG: tetratricopeptide repeat protein, partial [Candidatus Coatesbacteria bacterium]|nr:tetratricopeptide repeat protein [Candidatus Coatesbacteria bacterium]